MLSALLLITATATAGPPTSQVATLSVPGSALEAGSVDSDGDLFVFVGGDEVFMLDVSTWTLLGGSTCGVTSAVVVDDAPVDKIWVGCDNGEIRVFVIEDGELFVLTDGGGDLIIDSGGATPITDPVSGLYFADSEFGEPTVYAIYDSEPSTQMVAFNAEDFSAGNPITYLQGGVVAGAISDQALFVAHGGARVSATRIPNGTPLFQQAFSDIEVDDVVAGGGTGLLAMLMERGDLGQVVRYDSLTQALGPVLADAPGLQGVGLSVDPDEPWGLLAFEDRVDVVDAFGGLVTSGDALDSLSFSGTARDIVVGPAGYTAVGMTGGEVSVLTDRPWLSVPVATVGGVEVFAVNEGDEVVIESVSDQAGDWTVELGGDWDQPGSGAELAAGTLSEPGPIAATITASDWGEGANTLFVRIDAASGTGHAGVVLDVDFAPGTVALANSNLAFEDKRLTLTFDALAVDDIDRYTAYLSDAPFTAADYPTGGPEFDGGGGEDEATVEAPVVITEFTAGSSISVEFSPLTNEQTYYLAVRATDGGGLEGPMSAVIEGRPRPTNTAGDLAGERGGMDCDSSGGLAAWPLAMVGLLGLRRRRWALVAAGLVAVGTLMPAVATAQDEPAPEADEYPESEEPRFPVDDSNRDLTPAWGQVEVRYGLYRGVDESIESVYGNGPPEDGADGDRARSSANALMVEFGPQIYRVVEVDFGAGLMSRNGFTLDDEGKVSGTPARLMVVPLSVSITPRLHIFDEQPVVPFASLGADMWVFRERKGAGDADDKELLNGSKFGWHWEAGLNVLLDVFDRRRASLLEAQSGINDSWVTLSYRRQSVPSTDTGFDFSGDTFEVGLKLDF